ncbi:MAG: four helix bundle protein [Desulfobacterales bacterium]|nr:four helix bundle protein [Desulfobacterales bacterium]
MGGGFRDLQVWQKAKNFAVEIYRITGNGPLARDYGLRDQMRRAAVSVPSNIAEGDERDTNKESVRFFHIAKGSLAEVSTQTEIAFEIGYLTKENFEKICKECDQIGGMLGKLIKVRSLTHHP